MIRYLVAVILAGALIFIIWHCFPSDLIKTADCFLRHIFVFVLFRFVAYGTDPPFNIIAISGWLCLGFEDGGGKYYKLDLFGTYNCPIKHFPSSFTEFVGNSSKAIISYSINDCTHNTIVAEKEEILRQIVRGK